MELRARNWPDKKDKATANGDATICEFRDLFSFPEAMMSNFVGLIVEDDPFQRESLADLLKSEGLEVVECANAGVGTVLASTGPDLRALVTDVELGGEMSGVELAQYAKRKFPDLKVVMVSGHGHPTSRGTPTFS